MGGRTNFYVFLFLGGSLISAQTPGFNSNPSQTSITDTVAPSAQFYNLFFEALTQKASENYTLAINALLAANTHATTEIEKQTLLFELAKNYFLNKQFIEAEGYLAQVSENSALREPEITALRYKVAVAQHNYKEALPHLKQLSKNNFYYASLLAPLYLKLKQPQQATRIIDSLEHIYGETSITKTTKALISNKGTNTKQDTVSATNTLSQTIVKLEALAIAKQWESLSQQAELLIAQYPTQSVFYYYKAFAYFHQNNFNKAILEATNGTDWVLDNPPLLKKFYTLISQAYTALGNTEKAKEFLEKATKIK